MKYEHKTRPGPPAGPRKRGVGRRFGFLATQVFQKWPSIDSIMKLAILSGSAVALAGVVAASSFGGEKSVIGRAVTQRSGCGAYNDGDGDATPFPMPWCNGVSIEDATIDELQRWMTLGKLTSEQLVECYLARIEQTNP